jgi:hypothetical protein
MSEITQHYFQVELKLGWQGAHLAQQDVQKFRREKEDQPGTAAMGSEKERWKACVLEVGGFGDRWCFPSAPGSCPSVMGSGVPRGGRCDRAGSASCIFSMSSVFCIISMSQLGFFLFLEGVWVLQLLYYVEVAFYTKLVFN